MKKIEEGGSENSLTLSMISLDESEIFEKDDDYLPSKNLTFEERFFISDHSKYIHDKWRTI